MSEHPSIHCIRRVWFCAGHRVWGHENKCAWLHGHNYLAVFHASATRLDDIGRVIDFSVLKNRLGGWIEEHWDHGFILHRDDREARRAVESLADQRVFLLDVNPTAENLAAYLLHTVAPEVMAGTGVVITRVVVWETNNSSAEASL